MAMRAVELACSRGIPASTAVQAAQFDVTIVSAGEASNDAGTTIGLFREGLSARDLRTAQFDYVAAGGNKARRIGSELDRFACVASRLHCLDDRLFDGEGAAEFARSYVATARRAGRMAGLVCTNLPTVFFRRQEVIDAFGGHFDFVIGEPAEVLSLFGLKRIDTLVPAMAYRNIGLVLHRRDYPSIFLKPGGGNTEIGDTPISRETFWSEFAPSAFMNFLNPTQA